MYCIASKLRFLANPTTPLRSCQIPHRAVEDIFQILPPSACCTRTPPICCLLTTTAVGVVVRFTPREARHVWILLRSSTCLPLEPHHGLSPTLTSPTLSHFPISLAEIFGLVFLSSSRGSGVGPRGDGSHPDGWDAPPTSLKFTRSLTPRSLGGRSVACQSRDLLDGLHFNKSRLGVSMRASGWLWTWCRVLAPWSLSVSLSALRVRSLQLLCSVRALAITYGYRLVWVPFA